MRLESRKYLDDMQRAANVLLDPSGSTTSLGSASTAWADSAGPAPCQARHPRARRVRPAG